MPHLLIAHADQHHRTALATALDADGHPVLQASTAQHAVAQLAGQPVGLMLLHAHHPGLGLGLVRDLRAGRLDLAISPELPVVTLGPGSEVDVIRALDAGADFHLPEPVSPLLVRSAIDAVIRRASAGVHEPRRVKVGPIVIDAAARSATVDGEPLELTGREFDLLRRLASDPVRVFTKGELLRDIWGWETGGRTRTVDSHACRLRRKLADRGQVMIINRWGRGYALTSLESN